MSETLRRAMRKNLPLLTVQIFLAALNLTINQMNGGTTFWAIYPILGMAIPQVITIGQALLGESDAARDVSVNVNVKEHQYADQVRRYQEELEHRALLIESTTRSERLNVLAEQFGGWADKVEAMEEQVRLLKGDALVQNDLHTVTESLQTLQERILGESDAGVRRSLEQAATARRTQLAALEKLAATTRHAEAQLEATVASLGAIYTQAMTNLSTNHTADSRHLTAEVDERVRVLQDELAAIEEVRGGRTA